MENKVYNPAEIIKLRVEKSTVLVRVPRWFVDKHGLTRSKYLVFRDTLDGNIMVEPWEGYVNDKGKLKTRRSKGRK